MSLSVHEVKAWAGLAVALLCSVNVWAQTPTAPGAHPAPPRAAPATPSLPSTPMYSIPGANGGFQYLLKAIVDEKGLVRYDRFVRSSSIESALLDGTIEQYAKVKLPEGAADRLALWCNAYNANVLLMAFHESQKAGFVSVDKVSGFFDEQTITVAGEKLTLNKLEKERIASLGDPRAHVALVCAAMSAPPLRHEPYFADRLNDQLDDQCRRWINDPARNGVTDDALSLSMILDWYKDAFVGKPFGDRVGFVKQYADPKGPIAALLATNPKPDLRWKPYDWTLNRAGPGTGGAKSPRPSETPPPVVPSDKAPAVPAAPAVPPSGAGNRGGTPGGQP